MRLAFSETQDTICAPATAMGVSALAIIRISGSQALTCVAHIFSKTLHDKASHTSHLGWIRHQGKDIDQVVLSIYKNPHSFTGEDLIEITSHGSPYIQEQILHALLSHGIRLAKAGEFTMRAFLAGKLDLVQAEAIADLIHADNAAAHELAIGEIKGGFSKTLQKVRQNMIDFCGLLELELDFSGEDVAFADRTAFLAEINNIYQTIEPLLESFAWGNALKKGIAVAIIGKPNSGKSTLLNALLQEEKAIVSPIAGTTRDSIEDVWVIEGIPFRLIDTAGLRKTQDEIENLGIEKSYQKAESASVLVYLADAQENPVTINAELLALQEKTKTKKENTILVYNKIDLFPDAQTQESPLALHTLHISAKMGKNTHSLKDALLSWAKTQSKHTGTLSNVRHYNALANTLKYLKEVEKGLKNQVSADWLALDLRMALHEISEITGAVSSEDILDSIFSKFCIGK